MAEPAIRVENLGKLYRIAHEGQRGYKTLRDSLVQGIKGIGQRLRGGAEAQNREDFWALKDVSFEVQPGEVVGIIGRNGAGKSTLLKILSRITKPTKGRVTLNGRVGSLLEVGTGFHPELTGRENVYLNGSILGMSRKEIDKKFDEIVAFAEVEKFLDTPVKRYSSGMYVRLAFAVAAHLEPEILIVDEVLAVGDQEFQNKCLGKIKTVSQDGRSVIFVSHTMPVVQKLCHTCILLSKGEIEARGQAARIVDQYFEFGNGEMLAYTQPICLRAAKRWGGSGEAKFTEVRMYDPDDRAKKGGFRGGSVGFSLTIEGQTAVIKGVGIQITDDNDRKLINANTLEKTSELVVAEGQIIEFEISNVSLRPGRYKVGFWIGANENRHIDVVTDAAVLEVLPPEGVQWVSPHDGVFRCPFNFRILEGSPS